LASLASSYSLKEIFSSSLSFVTEILDFFFGGLGAENVRCGSVRWHE
jgi:hypothetical protein